MTKTPVYFVSHGGPPTMYDTSHPVYPRLQALGREIRDVVRPRAIVVFSAHWQAERPHAVEVNVSEDEPLLYDFYGFPRHYYAEKFPHRGSSELADRVIALLKESGIDAVPAERGLDHGVFVPFKVMFDSDIPTREDRVSSGIVNGNGNANANGKGNRGLDVPIVQVSLFDDDTDAASHLALGRAVSKLRSENVVIVVSGMAVHNLRHYRMTMGTGKTMPYTVTFDDAIKDAVEKQPGKERDDAMLGLLKRGDARQAHPTFEHLLPIHVGVGAAGEDVGKQLWTMPEGSMSWAQYRFGEVV